MRPVHETTNYRKKMFKWNTKKAMLSENGKSIFQKISIFGELSYRRIIFGVNCRVTGRFYNPHYQVVCNQYLVEIYTIITENLRNAEKNWIYI